ncbi:hypothetical protein TcCL_NonESM11813, partial [Trypanosoma cruzi]
MTPIRDHLQRIHSQQLTESKHCLRELRKEIFHRLQKKVLIPANRMAKTPRVKMKKMLHRLRPQPHQKATETKAQEALGKIQKQQQQPPTQLIRRINKTVTAAPRSPTPPPLFCFFFLLRVRLRLRWWPRESEDSRPHLTSRGTHNNVPIVYMH